MDNKETSRCPTCKHYDKSILEEPCAECLGLSGEHKDNYEQDFIKRDAKPGDIVEIIKPAFFETRIKAGDRFVVDEADGPNWVMVKHDNGTNTDKSFRRLNIGTSTFAIVLGL